MIVTTTRSSMIVKAERSSRRSSRRMDRRERFGCISFPRCLELTGLIVKFIDKRLRPIVPYVKLVCQTYLQTQPVSSRIKTNRENEKMATRTAGTAVARRVRQPRGLPSRRERVTLARVKKIYTNGSASSAKSERIANQGRTVPRPRMKIGKIKAKDASDKLPERFALRLRSIMAEHDWSSKDVADRLTGAGVKVGTRAIDAWLRGAASPKFKDLERIGRALGLRDYRELL